MKFYLYLFICFVCLEYFVQSAPQNNEAVKKIALERINKELEDLNRNAKSHFSAGPLDRDLFNWQAAIFGPFRTPYEGGIFYLTINFPINYPSRPPNVKFITRIFHTNINSNGTIDLPMLKNSWSPEFTIPKVLFEIQALLSEPKPQCVERPLIVEGTTEPPLIEPKLNCTLARTEPNILYVNNRRKYDQIARDWTQSFADED